MRVISGLSTEDSISFGSTKHKVALSSDNVCEYLSLKPEQQVKKDFEEKLQKEREHIEKRTKEVEEKNVIKKSTFKTKRKIIKKLEKGKFFEYFSGKHSLNFGQMLFLLFECVLLALGFVFDLHYITIGIAVISLILGIGYVIKAIVYFLPREELRRNHAAEHMTFNCNVKGLDVTKANIKKCSKYSNRCGSCKVANFIFIEIINLLLVIFLRVWIPHSIVFWFVSNLNIAIPGNFFAPLYQLFLTKEAKDKNIDLAEKTMLILINTERFSDKGEIISPALFRLIVSATLEIVNNEK